MRADIWKHVATAIERYLSEVEDLPVEAIPDQQSVRALMQRFTFESAMDPREALDMIIDAMRRMQTHPAHPRYFGLFNPAPTAMGIVGEVLAAAFNTQLAAWSHAPFAVQAEQHLIRSIGRRFGDAFQYGNFTSGGAEANLTALVVALVHRFPTFGTGGLRSIATQPVVYVSATAHHSFVKAMRITGLGTNALRIVPCDSSLGMDTGALTRMIGEDRASGHTPFFVVATAGATATGVVEPLSEIARIARAENLWLHVDAAWGGFAAFVPELACALSGITEADSITFDPHKMLSVPMGSGLFLTRRSDILGRTFAVTASYMPAHDEDDERADPFTHSIQWSRRFIGLKVLLSLAVAGWDGYARILRRQVEMGRLLRARLEQAKWRIVNDTPFPVVCFVPEHPDADVGFIAQRVQASGKAWISTATLPDGTAALRACITNYRSDERDIASLVDVLNGYHRAPLTPEDIDYTLRPPYSEPRGSL